jgi:adenylyl cyclase-associated protein
MEEALIGRLEEAVSRLEGLDARTHSSGAPRVLADVNDPAILAFDELIAGALRRVSAAAGKIGVDVAEMTRLVEKAFLVGRDLLIRTKRTQVRCAYILFLWFYIFF